MRIFPHIPVPSISLDSAVQKQPEKMSAEIERQFSPMLGDVQFAWKKWLTTICAARLQITFQKVEDLDQKSKFILFVTQWDRRPYVSLTKPGTWGVISILCLLI